jgi:hypothetical protein
MDPQGPAARPRRSGYQPVLKKINNLSLAEIQAQAEAKKKVLQEKQDDQAIQNTQVAHRKIFLRSTVDYSTKNFPQYLREVSESGFGEFDFGSRINAEDMQSIIDLYADKELASITMIISDDKTLSLFANFIQTKQLKKIHVECYNIKKIALSYLISAIEQHAFLEYFKVKINNFNSTQSLSTDFCDLVIENSKCNFNIYLDSPIKDDVFVDVMLAFKRSKKQELIIYNHKATQEIISNITEVFRQNNITKINISPNKIEVIK